MDYRLALLTGIDIPVPECQLTIHPPSIKEIALIGDKDFFIGVQCLCVYKNMFVKDKNDLLTVNNFQIFMMIMQDKEAKDKRIATQQVLTLIFPNYNVLLTPNSILLKKDQEIIIIDESNFELIQEIWRDIFCMKNAPMDQTAFNPQGERAREIAEKLQRGRDRIAAERNESNSSVFVQYLSTLTVALHIPLQQLSELTMFQLYDLVERYILWIKWDLDVRTRLAGGKPDSQPDNWMKNIH